jgi:hypothetical protein
MLVQAHHYSWCAVVYSLVNRVYPLVQEFGVRTVVVSSMEAAEAGVTVGDQYEWDEVRSGFDATAQGVVSGQQARADFTGRVPRKGFTERVSTPGFRHCAQRIHWLKRSAWRCYGMPDTASAARGCICSDAQRMWRLSAYVCALPCCSCCSQGPALRGSFQRMFGPQRWP